MEPAPRGTSTPVPSLYMPQVVSSVATLTPVANVPTQKSDDPDLSVETQAILAELDAPEAQRQRQKHFRLPLESLPCPPKPGRVIHPPTFQPTRGQSAPSIPGYTVKYFLFRRKVTHPSRVPTKPRTAGTKILGLARPENHRPKPLMNFNTRRLKSILKHLRNVQ